MQDVYNLLFVPTYRIITYPIHIYNFTFSIKDLLIVEMVVVIAFIVIRAFMSLISPAWMIGQDIDTSLNDTDWDEQMRR